MRLGKVDFDSFFINVTRDTMATRCTNTCQVRPGLASNITWLYFNIIVDHIDKAKVYPFDRLLLSFFQHCSCYQENVSRGICIAQDGDKECCACFLYFHDQVGYRNNDDQKIDRETLEL